MLKKCISVVWCFFRRLKFAAESVALKKQEEEWAAAAMARGRSDALKQANEFDAHAYISRKGAFCMYLCCKVRLKLAARVAA